MCNISIKGLTLLVIGIVVLTGCMSKDITPKKHQNNTTNTTPITKYSDRNFINVIWQNSYNLVQHQNVSNPIDAIQKDIASQIETYLKQRKPIDIGAKIPPKIKEIPYPKKIPKPKKPKDIVLVCGRFESPEDFKQRQQRERDIVQQKNEQLISDYNERVKARREKIIQQNRAYNQKVKEINLEIERLKRIRKKDIAYLQDEYRNRKTNIVNLLPKFASNSFAKYLGNPIVTYEQYNYPQQLLQLKIKSEYNNWEKIIQLKISPKKASNIQKNNNLAKAKIVYTLHLKENNNALSFSFDKFNIEYNNHIYLASNSSSIPHYQPPTATIKTGSIETFIPDITPKKPVTRQENYVPNKINSIPVPKVILVSDNDLIEQLKSTPSKAKDNKKWLFVVGIENYDYTNSIAFSKRTTETFIKVAQKNLGVNKNQSYIFVENKATSGAIKDGLNDMIKKVKEGDSIYFYYSGHGIPASSDRVPYMLPKDKLPNSISRSPFFKLTNIYNLLCNSKADKIIAIIDSCFTGSTDGKIIIEGVASIVLAPKKVTFNHNKMVVMTAGGAKQFSNMYKEKKHRLFSYFLMKALLEGKRNISEIYRDIFPKVHEVSLSFGNLNEQNITIEGNTQLSFPK